MTDREEKAVKEKQQLLDYDRKTISLEEKNIINTEGNKMLFDM